MNKKILGLLVALMIFLFTTGCFTSNNTASQKESERFIEVYSQSQILIYKDSFTNVHYLIWWDAYKGGVTPLLDSEGNVLTTLEQESK